MAVLQISRLRPNFPSVVTILTLLSLASFIYADCVSKSQEGIVNQQPVTATAVCGLADSILPLLLGGQAGGSIDAIYDLFAQVLAENPTIYGSAFGASPEAVQMLWGDETNQTISSPYCFKSSPGVAECFDIAVEAYDYTSDQLGNLTEWYTVLAQAASQGEKMDGYWTNEYFDEGAGNILMITYSLPVFDRDTFLGVVSGDFPVGQGSVECLVAGEEGIINDMPISGSPVCGLTNSILPLFKETTPITTAIFELFTSYLSENQEIYGAGYGASPEAVEMYFGGDTNLTIFAPFCFKATPQTVECIDIAVEAYDYTDNSLGNSTEWYTVVAESIDQGDMIPGYWTNEYFDEGAGNILMVTFSVPIFQDDIFMGVVTSDFPVSG